MHVQSILCVCTGNICRSPLAEAYLRRALPSLLIASAGIGALEGQGVDSQARRIAEREGLDIDRHIAQQIDASLARQHDLILVMEQDQSHWIRSNYPEASGRIFLVSQWQDREDVADPFRKSEEYFDDVYQRLTVCLDAWIEKLPARRATTG